MKNEKHYYCVPLAEIILDERFIKPSVLVVMAKCHEFLFREVAYEKQNLEHDIDGYDCTEHRVVDPLHVAPDLQKAEDDDKSYSTDWASDVHAALTKAYPDLAAITSDKVEIVLHVRILA